jgi:hypothetical protein
MAITPQTAPHERDRIGEGRQLFRIPGSRANRHGLTFDQALCHQSHQREQSQKNRCRPGNRQVAPLSLSFDASDNVAKPLIEFAVNIPRERLRPAPADRRRHR